VYKLELSRDSYSLESAWKAPGFTTLDPVYILEKNWFKDLLFQMGQLVCRYATGKQAYCGVVRMLWERNVSFRLLALTATPGHGGAVCTS
jgi:hypothetical protein